MTKQKDKFATQKITQDLTMLHNTEAWREWFDTNFQDRFCTFQHKGKTLMGRIHKYGDFLGFAEPGHVPEYEIVIKGPSQKEITRKMVADSVKVHQTLSDAEKDCGYTWESRFRYRKYEDLNESAKRATKTDKTSRMKQKLKEAENDWEKTPWPQWERK